MSEIILGIIDCHDFSQIELKAPLKNWKSRLRSLLLGKLVAKWPRGKWQHWILAYNYFCERSEIKFKTGLSKIDELPCFLVLLLC